MGKKRRFYQILKEEEFKHVTIRKVSISYACCHALDLSKSSEHEKGETFNLLTVLEPSSLIAHAQMTQQSLPSIHFNVIVKALSPDY